MNSPRSGIGVADTTPREREEARGIHAALQRRGARGGHGHGPASRNIGAPLLDPLILSPYLCQPLDRSYRDFLDEQIARLEAERRSLDDQLAMLREERERFNSG
jgi:hypothetical protein